MSVSVVLIGHLDLVVTNGNLNLLVYFIFALIVFAFLYIYFFLKALKQSFFTFNCAETMGEVSVDEGCLGYGRNPNQLFCSAYFQPHIFILKLY